MVFVSDVAAVNNPFYLEFTFTIGLGNSDPRSTCSIAVDLPEGQDAMDDNAAFEFSHVSSGLQLSTRASRGFARHA
ncbi:hypothetical protein VP1G_10885 [Cytospora mali]|uniref:Uncharacterized protein n=1 Tax=Cytospora mali TaxID=578113 RepID=A0A194UYM6_CYTMA|nr:hypothetical protein VP1G_10885 [Valsa mali var. pyri (nom. inval.)]